MGDAPRGTPVSALNASYHKEKQYRWFRGVVLNGFQDIKPYMNWRGWGIPRGDPGQCHWSCNFETRIPRKASSHLLGQKSQEPQSERGY